MSNVVCALAFFHQTDVQHSQDYLYRVPNGLHTKPWVHTPTLLQFSALKDSTQNIVPSSVTDTIQSISMQENMKIPQDFLVLCNY